MFMGAVFGEKGFFRTNDTTYMGFITSNPDDTPVEVSLDFECSDELIKPEQRRRIADKLFNKKMTADEKSGICGGYRELYFQSNGRNYVIAPKSNLIFRIICSIFRFLKVMKGSSKVDYKIVRSGIPSLFYKPRLVVQVSDKSNLTIDSYANRLQSSNVYHDPFTQLATTLFQDYEPFHSWKDVKEHPYRDASKYQIVIQNNNLVAKEITNPDVKKEEVQEAFKAFRDYAYRHFGETAIKRIQAHYEFDLDEMINNFHPLTPEIIYRINVGSSHIEAVDIEKLAQDLKDQKILPERVQQKINPTVFTPDFISSLDVNNPDHFAKLANCLNLTEAEHNKIFTGRMLHGKISSWYTQGDESLYKPWVDQQEFAQVCFKIPNRDWKCFYEDLAMIICKKHLHQKNADQTYRVGTLIPAPREPGKPQTYYKVTSWIHNSRGIYSYTLEPACPGTNLPAIKLYRSTSLSAYNLDGASSYKNDFNPINPPGYEGSHLLDPYETEFFDKRTIPVWVGYQNLADKKIAALTSESVQDVRETLLQANRSLIESITSKYKKPTMKQYLRKYDSEFMELIQACRESGVIGAYTAWYLLSNSLRDTVLYKYNEQTKEVKYLKSFLEKAQGLPQFTSQATKLLSWWNWENRSPTESEQTFITTLTNFETNFSHDVNVDVAKSAFSSWSQFIDAYAKEKHEDVGSKIAQNLDFAGHSLGAACAQQSLVRYTTAKGRIPLPGHTISARLFDDPAINKSDNKSFIEFGNKHADLLNSLQSTYAIVRRQETRDPVPQSGEVHLGATKTSEQHQRSVKWLRFDAALQSASSKAKHPQVRDYHTAHGRLFAGASSRGAWLKSWLHERIPQLEKNDPLQAARLKDALKKIPDTDYKITYYDSRTQWDFDRPSTVKLWRSLRGLWKLPFGFDPIYAERLRTWLSAFFRSGFLYHFLPKIIAQLGQANPPDDRAHGDWKRHCDARGVFVVRSGPSNKSAS